MHKKIKKSINATLVSALVISSFPMGDIEVKAEGKKSIHAKTVEFTAPNTLSDALLPPAELSSEETLVQQGPKPGTYNLTTFDDEIQVKNDQKKWVKVNTELKQNSEADYTPIATDLEVKFDSKIDNKTPLLKVGEKKTESIAYVLKGIETDQGIQPIQSSQASVDENSILHPNILNGVDLRHIVLNKEVKEDIILKQNVPGLKAFIYEINTPLQAVLDKKGHIEFKNTKDEVVYTMPVPMMSDSNKDSKSGLSAESYDIKYELKSIENGYELKLIPDLKWTTDEDRVFPLYIDPSVAKDASLDTFVSSASPTTSYNKYWNSSLGEYVLRVGKYDTATGTNYAFVKMPSLSELKGAEISAASLKTYVKWNYYAGTKTGLWVDRVNSTWSETGVTWNTKPSSTNITSTTVSRDQWATFNVLSAMKTIADGSRTDYGFKFHTNGNGQTYWKQLTAGENNKNKTNLSVTYSYPQMGSLKTSVYPTGAGATTGYIDLSWPAAKNASNYRLQLYNGKGWRTIYTGTDLSYSTKGKRFWPTSTQYETKDSLTGGVAFRNGDGMELPMDPSPMYTASTGSTSTSKAYQFRIVADYPLGTSTPSTVVKPTLEGIIPDKPNAPTYSAYANETDSKGYFNLEWDGVEGATSYDIELFNGNKYERFSVGDETSWTSKGKRIFPTEEQAATLTVGQTNVFRKSGDGRDFLTDPRVLYRKTGTGYNNSTNYFAKVIAKSSKGESSASAFTRIYFPVKNIKAETTGYEDNRNQESGFLFSRWNANPEALGYAVSLSNGKEEQIVALKSANELSWTSRDQKIWPLESQGYKLRTDGEGRELPFDPSGTYDLSGGNIPDKQAYYVRVRPYRAINSAVENIYDPSRYIGLSELKDTDISTATIQKGNGANLGNEEFFPLYEVGNTSINLSNGNQLFEASDASLPGRGPDVSIDRTFNSIDQTIGLFGRGWSSSLERRISLVKIAGKVEMINLREADGTSHNFINDGSGTFLPPTGIDYEITTVAVGDKTEYYVQSTDGVTEVYDEDGYLVRIEYDAKEEGKKNKVVVVYTITDSGEKRPTMLLGASDAGEGAAENRQNRLTVSYKPETNLVEEVILTASSDDSIKKRKYAYSYNDKQELVSIIESDLSDGGKSEETKYGYATPAESDTAIGTQRINEVILPGHDATVSNKLTFNSTILEDSTEFEEAYTETDETGVSTQAKLGKEVDGSKITSYKVVEDLVDGSGNKVPNSADSTTLYNSEGNLIEENTTSDGKASKTIYRWMDQRLTETVYPDGETELTEYGKRKLAGTTKDELDDQVQKEFDATSSTTYEYASNDDDIIKEVDEFKLMSESGLNDDREEIVDHYAPEQQIGFTEYNSIGNVTRTGASIGPAVNLIQNGGFEKTANWTGGTYISTGKSGRALTLKGAIASQEVSVIGGDPYNLNAYFKTTGAAKATARVVFYDATGKLLKTQTIQEIGDVSDWVRGTEEMTSPSTATKAKIELEGIGADTVYFDSVQLNTAKEFKAVSASSFNFVENGGFDSLTSWTLTNAAKSDNGYESTSGVQLNANGVAEQTVVVAQKSAVPFYISALAKNASPETTLEAIATFTDGTTSTQEVAFQDVDQNTAIWQRQTAQFVSDKSVSNVKVRLKNTAGVSYVDAVRVSEGRAVETSSYDAQGNNVVASQGLTKTGIKNEVNAYGDVLKEIQGDKVKTNEYDFQGRMVKSIAANGTEIFYEYDKKGNVISKKVGTNSPTIYEYDSKNRIISSTTPGGKITKYTYNNLTGKVTQITFPSGSSMYTAYNAEGQITAIKTQAKGASSSINEYEYSYTADGDIASVVSSRLGSKKSYSYDAGTSATIEGTATKTGTGRLTDIVDYFGQKQNFKYVTAPNGVQTELVSEMTAGNLTSAYNYDAGKRNDGVTVDGLKWTFRHDELGRLIQNRLPGITAGESLIDYSDTGAISSWVSRAGTRQVAFEKYSYDKYGNLTERNTSFGKSTYTYDKLDQLVSETTPLGTKSYEYDAKGNRTKDGSTTATFDSDNRLTNYGSEVISYDDNGNRLKDGKLTYQWDELSRVSKVTLSNGATVSYMYDEFNRRIEKKVGSETIRFQYDGDTNQLLAETDATGAPIRQYVYTNDGLLLAVKTKGNWFFYHKNYRGDVVALTDVNGSTAATYDYDSWGNPVAENIYNADVANQPILYAGYYWDKETSLYYLMARYYHPKHGVFLSIDPELDSDETIELTNGYSYVGNAPILKIDPDGDVPVPVIVGGVIWAGRMYKAYKSTKVIRKGRKTYRLVAPIAKRNKYWTRVTNFKGHRVYQRNDIFPVNSGNMKLMKRGRAPYGYDGKRINLHHMTQRNRSSLAEVTSSFHSKNSRVIHINNNRTKSGINRSKFNTYRKAYWKNRYNNLYGRR
ncbi:DNRLRE domain-containing protein [Exiguobacterium sp. s192]|uniref:DNRLRE domain-containing protein n=1 Tax=Exiguobacterium sp. s192 TaxID=2751206 RepID=UPI001BE949E7|nr:DNRLRE domain-containing protein [Exiguobacterium sp. s192]